MKLITEERNIVFVENKKKVWRNERGNQKQ